MITEGATAWEPTEVRQAYRDACQNGLNQIDFEWDGDLCTGTIIQCKGFTQFKVTWTEGGEIKYRDFFD